MCRSASRYARPPAPTGARIGRWLSGISRITDEWVQQFPAQLVARLAAGPTRAHGATKQIIVNLLSNAVKFTPQGGKVEIGLLRRGDDAVVRVSDSGPGIAAGEVDLVAKRFYRSDKSRRDPGLGLGLSLVAAIVKLHGFRFSISPGPGCVAEIVGHRIAA